MPLFFLYLTNILLGSSKNGRNLTFGLKASHYIEYVHYMRKYLVLTLWSLVSYTAWTSVFQHASDTSYSSWYVIIGNIWMTMIFGSFFLCVEKFGLQLFAVRFHQRVYQERIDDNKKAYKILNSLNSHIKPSKAALERGDSSSLDDLSEILVDNQHSHPPAIMNGIHSFSIQVLSGLGLIVSAAVGLELPSVSHFIVVLNSPHEARLLAKKIFQVSI